MSIKRFFSDLWFWLRNLGALKDPERLRRRDQLEKQLKANQSLLREYIKHFDYLCPSTTMDILIGAVANRLDGQVVDVSRIEKDKRLLSDKDVEFGEGKFVSNWELHWLADFIEVVTFSHRNQGGLFNWLKRNFYYDSPESWLQYGLKNDYLESLTELLDYIEQNYEHDKEHYDHYGGKHTVVADLKTMFASYVQYSKGKQKLAQLSTPFSNVWKINLKSIIYSAKVSVVKLLRSAMALYSIVGGIVLAGQYCLEQLCSYFMGPQEEPKPQVNGVVFNQEVRWSRVQEAKGPDGEIEPKEEIYLDGFHLCVIDDQKEKTVGSVRVVPGRA